jgi:hypothetical protein
MPTTNKLFGRVFISAFNKEINLTADTIKVALYTSASNIDQDVSRYKGDLTGEVSNVGTNYATGGVTITTPVVSYDAPSNTVKFTASNPLFVDLNCPDYRYAVIYDATPATDATRPLIGYVDFGQAIPGTGDITIQWNATGGVFVVVSA